MPFYTAEHRNLIKSSELFCLNLFRHRHKFNFSIARAKMTRKRRSLGWVVFAKKIFNLIEDFSLLI